MSVAVYENLLKKNGIYVKSEWLEACINFIRGQIKANASNEEMEKLIMQQLLIGDLNAIGNGNIFSQVSSNHNDVKNVHNKTIKGPYVIQIDEVVDISSPLQEQILSQKVKTSDKNEEDEENEEEEEVGSESQDVATQKMLHDTMEKYGNQTQERNRFRAPRMLKFSCTDGTNRFFAIELRFIPTFTAETLPGTKILIRDVLVRRGLLLLVPECIRVLGGRVDELVELNKKKKAFLHDKLSGKPIKSKKDIPLQCNAERLYDVVVEPNTSTSRVITIASHDKEPSIPEILEDAEDLFDDCTLVNDHQLSTSSSRTINKKNNSGSGNHVTITPVIDDDDDDVVISVN